MAHAMTGLTGLTGLPDSVPVLSRGKHRNPRKGACFMEMASYLAGERWSDRPRCTHPLLAEVARLVNDNTSDANRSQLAELIPAVIGTATEDLRVDARIARLCALRALPVVSAERQNVMAVTLITADRMLATLEGRPTDEVSAQTARAFDDVPSAARWARRYSSGTKVSMDAYRRQSAPSTVRCAVRGVAEACVPDPDAMLRQMLLDAIAVCAGSVPTAAPATARSGVRAARVSIGR